MRAFTTFNVEIYPIQHAEGRKKRLNINLKESCESHFQEDGMEFSKIFILPSLAAMIQGFSSKAAVPLPIFTQLSPTY
jgi:hypothetical protein